MVAFVLGVMFVLAGLLLPLFLHDLLKPLGRGLAAIAAFIVGLVLIIFSTSLWVGSSKGGLITKKFGEGLKDGHIIAVNGERGVQAEILSPGWSFGWAPWQYDLESVDNIVISEGSVGVVAAMDGNPLPDGDVYAPAWDSPTLMIDAKTFMMKGGCKGPQLTVLPPGQYRYNPKLYEIKSARCVDVPIGYVGVVRANAGRASDGTTTNQVVNGVPLVPRGYKGIWVEPLMPGQYYLHPNA